MRRVLVQHFIQRYVLCSDIGLGKVDTIMCTIVIGSVNRLDNWKYQRPYFSVQIPPLLGRVFHSH